MLTAIARAAVDAAAADPAADRGDAEARRRVLAAVLHDRFGFAGDERSYDDPANANLIRVMERRRGLPVALGILWLHAMEAAGWGAHGIDFPGHFLIALEAAHGQLVLECSRGARRWRRRSARPAEAPWRARRPSCAPRCCAR